MNLILGIDLETNGIDPLSCDVAEIGAVLWDTDTNQPVRLMSEIIKGVQMPDDVAALTGITNEVITISGINAVDAWGRLVEMIKMSKVMVAHNGLRFDFPLMKRMLSINHFSPPSDDYIYVDTMFDIPYTNPSSLRLNHLAADHGFLNANAHRAVFDVMTMLTILSKYNVKEIITNAASPVVTIQAVVNYDSRERARARGFRWEPTARVWVKSVRESQLPKEENSEFTIRKITL